ncbi:peptidoglycan-binding protein [Cereibacter sphaeroides]|uniref:peptidoglycan-binding protein n=1 Tax=Cereibacter sphaeroides TaxID=1063 RepID=UPI000F53A76D|nr:peptidoglycan-binding protein [Cereibacter sphaeroides]AZB54890.1 peptidoglycan-binding protein [Cereibacter sphaeroides]AZB59141.1 peptidoglycan-binding protein [Cereibacter sphaeroides]
MIRRPALLALLLLTACGGPVMPEPPRPPDLTIGIRTEKPAPEAGICWAGEEGRWFEAPCPDLMTPERIATLQRALEARGLYAGEITEELDTRTRSGIRKLQAPLGLDSDRLSLAAARALGLVPIELSLPEEDEPESPLPDPAGPADATES